MDKYEYNLRIDQISQAVGKRDISTAVKIADEIDWRKEKDVSVLLTLADAYELNKNYKIAKEILLQAYEKSQAGRQMAYRLAILSAKIGEFDEAEEFYQDFVDIAPRDTARYILQYRIARERKDSIEHLIEILETYVDLDMEERWMYELAKLYHLAGKEEKCVDLCDEMSLWFSHGKYVRKAMDLKKQYKPLTKRQEENYNKTDADMIVPEKKETAQAPVEQAVHKEEKTEQPAAEEEKKPASLPFTILKPQEEEEEIPQVSVEDIHLEPLSGDGSDTIDLQVEIAKNLKEIMDSEQEMKQIKAENEAKPDRITMTLDPLFKYDSDGQIGLDIEEPQPEEKQITGQISIEEVLRNLEERGILKTDTVNKTVETLDQAAEAVDRAAEEAAIKAEEQKEKETIVQEFEVKDLAEDGEMEEVKSALESYADDTVNGFVFTDEIDSETIDEVLQDQETIPMPGMEAEEVPMTKEEELIGNTKEVTIPVYQKQAVESDKIEEEVLADGNIEQEPQTENHIIEEAPTEEDDFLSIENNEPVELSNDIPILDLSFDVPMKKLHTGIKPDAKPVAANTASLKELFADLDEATKKEIGILESEDKQAAETTEPVEIRTPEVTTVENDTNTAAEQKGAEEAPVETEKENITKEQTVEQAEPSVMDIRREEEPDNTVEMESAVSDMASKVEEEEPEENNAEPEVHEMPQVKVNKNPNLTQTMSLNLDKVMVSDEEMTPFESFKSVNGLEQKLKDTVVTLATTYTASGNSETGNIMILGDDKSGKTTMAIELIKLINKKRGRTGRKIAKVDSSVLNTRGIRSSMKKLVGNDLIVENAQHLRKTILNEFVSVGQYYTDDMLMVFEGETSALKTMRNENEEIAEMFNHVLVIKEYDVKEWVAYAKKYAGTKNYMIDEMGTLALYKTIDDFYSRHQGIDQSDVENLINRAIKKASAKVTRRFTNLFSGKNDDTGMDILKEVDFK